MSKRIYILASGILLAIVIAPFAVAATTSQPILGGKRSPSSNSSQAYTSETQIIANNSTYGTRQSNKSANGGGAIYGCRSGAGGTATHNSPCIRSSNLAKGFAFEFSTAGTQGGLITVGGGGDATKPFTTNATGVATGLNADRVDSLSAADIVKAGQTAGATAGASAGQTAGATAGASAAASASNNARPYAQVTAGGAAGTLRGVATNGVSRSSVGVYSVVFSGDVSKCAVATGLVGTAAALITATPTLAGDSSSTTFDVRTFDPTGAVLDHAFHLSLDC